MESNLNDTRFGYITVEGQRINYNVLIRLDVTMERRKKKLSKEIYATSHTISLAEAEHVFEDGAEGLLIGGEASLGG